MSRAQDRANTRELEWADTGPRLEPAGLRRDCVADPTCDRFVTTGGMCSFHTVRAGRR